LGNGFAGFDISKAAQEDRLEGVRLLEIANDGSEGGGVPTFGGSVSGAGKDGEVGLGGGVFWFGKSGWWGDLGFAFGKAEILEKTEILFGHVDVAVWGCSARTMIDKKKITDRA
jgi:hypothetical protein